MVVLHRLDHLLLLILSSLHVYADRSLYHGKVYIGKYIPGIKAYKHCKVQKIQENNLLEVCNEIMSASQKPSLSPAYRTSCSAVCISLYSFAKPSPFEVQILHTGWYGFRLYPSQFLLSQGEKQVMLDPGKYCQPFLQNPKL